jgi:hypothetical protein
VVRASSPALAFLKKALMGIEHVNRKGDRYFLQATMGRDGKPRYSFTRKLKGTAVAGIPEGYQVYESPDDAQVFLRKVKPEAIGSLEKQLVVSAVRGKAGLEHFIVEVDGKSIVVYLPDTDGDEVARMFRDIVPVLAAKARALADDMIRRSRYSKMMRFTLCDLKRRLFNCERWCFLGGIDDWNFLAGAAPLSELVEEYVPHLGKDSFFELM